MTSYVNETTSSGKFSDSLKLSNIELIRKKKDPIDKCNYRLVSILPLLSKVFAKIMFDQLYIYMNSFLNKVTCRFPKAHSTEDALDKFLPAWQKELENSGFIGTILLDLQKV